MGTAFMLSLLDEEGQELDLAEGTACTIVAHYSQESAPAVDEETIALYYWDGTQWVREPSSAVDTAANKVTATPEHLSLWTLLGNTYQVSLPLVLR
jgi:hypothetical protein